MATSAASPVRDKPASASNPPWLMTHFWLLDLLKGVLLLSLFALALLSITAFRSILYTGLGAYLIADGALDLLSSLRAHHQAADRPTHFVSGMLSIALGILMIVLERRALLFILLYLGLRFSLAGWGNIARSVASISLRNQLSGHRVGEGERWLWLTGLGKVLSGLVMMLLASTLLTVYSLFLLIYLLVDGVIYVYEAWLKSRPAVAAGYAPWTQMASSAAEVPVTSPNLPAALRGVAFVRRTGANGLGHASFAFEWPAGYFIAGSVENPSGAPFAPPHETGAWTAYTLDVVSAMQRQVKPYDEYKIFFVDNAQPDAAIQTVAWVDQQGYSVARRNCADAAYDALRAYGVKGLVDTAQFSLPNSWYDHLPGLSYRITEHPIIPVRGDSKPHLPGAESEVDYIAIPFEPDSPVTAPAWRNEGGRGLYEIEARLEYINEQSLRLLKRVSSFVVQRLKGTAESA
jgi:uncharacterized membrane protein HdeD (DUF308 family)